MLSSVAIIEALKFGFFDFDFVPQKIVVKNISVDQTTFPIESTDMTL